MRKEKLFCVLDTETCGTVEKPIVYNLGYIIFNKKGKIYAKRSIVISDIFFNSNLEVTKAISECYYCNKIPQYKQGILRGRCLLRTFQQAKDELATVLKKYNVQDIWCYNAGFDKRALKNTTILKGCGYNYVDEVTFKDIWNCASELICNNRNYCTWAYQNGFESKKGNVKTSAEVVYRYLTKDTNFIESHTALDDCFIEKEIFLACKRKKKKISCACGSHWMIPQAKYKKVKSKQSKE